MSTPDAVETTVTVPACIHCGERCSSGVHGTPDQPFCCMGCKTVYELLNENGLTHYYRIESTPGPSLRGRETSRDFGYLDEPAVRERVLDFYSDRAARVSFHIPAIHCAACVWLLENLFRVNPAIGLSRVNMGTREVRLQFDPSKLPLSGLVNLLTGMGYEPALTLRDLEKPVGKRRDRSIILRIGYAGFAFGNVMMMSFPAYLGLSTAGEALLLKWFGGLSLLLCVPLMLFSASPFWRSAWTALRRKTLNIDFPIATGLLALFFGSLGDVLRGEGPGYLDSLSGLVFFLLIGR
ncbi:MAG: heavy metal translocating P-type ATPase metal-binding domain-containing protein, partial [Kiritimatiellia bacterium]